MNLAYNDSASTKDARVLKRSMNSIGSMTYDCENDNIYWISSINTTYAELKYINANTLRNGTLNSIYLSTHPKIVVDNRPDKRYILKNTIKQILVFYSLNVCILTLLARGPILDVRI